MFFPQGAAAFAGEIHQRGPASPIAFQAGTSCFGVGEESVSVPEFAVQRVLGEQGRLDVGAHRHPQFLHAVQEGFRVGEAVVVPAEHAAFPLLGGVARGKVEAVAAQAVALQVLHELKDLAVAVPFRLGEVHGGRYIPQRSAVGSAVVPVSQV